MIAVDVQLDSPPLSAFGVPGVSGLEARQGPLQKPADDEVADRRVVHLRKSSDAFDVTANLAAAVREFRQPALILDTQENGRVAAVAGSVDLDVALHDVKAKIPTDARLAGILPGTYPEWLGSRRFAELCGSRFPYVVGEMARGISSARLVIESVRAGFVAFFGSAGLRPHATAEAIDEITAAVGADSSWGANLIHSPDRPERESEIVDLFLEKRVRKVSASAFMGLSKDVVRYSASGLERDSKGAAVRKNHVFAKISRVEVAEPFMSPPPADLLRELVAAGKITEDQAEMQTALPVAEFVTVESDSGGHTDNRPLGSLFPVIAELRDRIVQRFGYENPIQLGAAGGLGTPSGVASAFGLGADYVVTGSVNQSAVESGQSEAGRAMLCEAGIADVTMAPAADMFELGVKVQVLKRGTMFAVKAQRLYELFRRHGNVEQFPAKDREWLEKQVLRESFESSWARILEYKAKTDPAFAAKNDRNPRDQLAHVIRLFLFMGSQWAREGNEERKADFQIWCGPAMGAFNDWARGSFLEPCEARSVRQIGLNLLEGAAQATRARQLRSFGVMVPESLCAYRPQAMQLA